MKHTRTILLALPAPLLAPALPACALREKPASESPDAVADLLARFAPMN